MAGSSIELLLHQFFMYKIIKNYINVALLIQIKAGMQFFQSLLKYILPVEWVLLFGILIIFIGNRLMGLPLLSPSIFTCMVFFMYFMPSYFVVLLSYRQAKHGKLRDGFYIMRCYFAILFCCYMVYSIKLWSHIISNGQYYDDIYRQFDLFLAPLIDLERKINEALGIPISIDWYTRMYNISFILILITCFYKSARLFHACFAALAINLVLGGVSYSFAPALGPFIYWPSENWEQIHYKYYDSTMLLIQTKGSHLIPDNFIFSLGAMPSLHISITATFVYYAWKTNRMIGVLGVILVIYFIVQSKLTGLHYYADILIGFVLAAISVIAGNKLTSVYLEKNGKGKADIV